MTGRFGIGVVAAGTWWLAMGCDSSTANRNNNANPAQTLLTGVGMTFLTADDLALYWSELGGGRLGPIKRVPKNDATPARVEVVGDGFQPVVVGGLVYTTTATTVSTLALVRYAAPGQMSAVGTFPGYGSHMAADDQNVYFSTYDFPTSVSQIWAQSVDGSAARVLVPDAHGQAYRMVAGGGEVYWAADPLRSTRPYADGVLGVIRKVSSAGGEAVTVFESPSFIDGGLSLDAASLFFIADEEDPGAVPAIRQALFRLERQSGAIQMLTPTTGTRASSLAHDAEHVYWVQRSPGGVGRIPIAGGMVAMLASVDDLNGIVVDADHIYLTTWIDAARGSLLRLPKRSP